MAGRARNGPRVQCAPLSHASKGNVTRLENRNEIMVSRITTVPRSLASGSRERDGGKKKNRFYATRYAAECGVYVYSEIKVNYTSAPASEKCHYDKPIDRVDVSPTLISSVGVAKGVANRCITSRPETRFVRIVTIPCPFRRADRTNYRPLEMLRER